MQSSAGPRSGFDHVYAAKVWGAMGGGSGPGSSLMATKGLSALLTHFVMAYQISSLLDSSCGSMEWMPGTLEAIDEVRAIDGLFGQPAKPPLNYTGADVVGALITQHQKRFAKFESWKFIHADMTADDYPNHIAAHDVVLARDVFFHLTSDKVLAALRNFQRTGSRWLLATHSPYHVQNNSDVATSRPDGLGLNEGGVRKLNLYFPPYNLPKAKWEFTEADRTPRGTKKKADKRLSLWRLEELNLPS